jgi:ATP adenylyltransferase
MDYIRGEGDESKPAQISDGAQNECFICRAARERDDRRNLVILRTKRTITVLNRYPYNNGHLLVASLAHKGRLDELERVEQAELLEVMGRLVKVLEQVMHAEGFNLGLNLGRVAGAGLPDHLHWHIVPRWSGDTNFMPSLAGVKVIPQSLDALWELLSDQLSTRE